MMRGCPDRKLLNNGLQEFMWRDRFGDNALNNLFYHISIQFQL